MSSLIENWVCWLRFFALVKSEYWVKEGSTQCCLRWELRLLHCSSGGKDEGTFCISLGILAKYSMTIWSASVVSDIVLNTSTTLLLFLCLRTIINFWNTLPTILPLHALHCLLENRLRKVFLTHSSIFCFLAVYPDRYTLPHPPYHPRVQKRVELWSTLFSHEWMNTIRTLLLLETKYILTYPSY